MYLWLAAEGGETTLSITYATYLAYTTEGYIKSQLNGLVLQVLNPPANTQLAYRDVVMASPINIAAQKWTLVPENYKAGYYLVQSKLNGMVIDVRGANTAAGTRIIADPKNLL